MTSSPIITLNMAYTQYHFIRNSASFQSVVGVSMHIYTALLTVSNVHVPC